MMAALNYLGRNRMGVVMVNELACSEIVGSSHDLVKPITIKYQIMFCSESGQYVHVE
jgi:hypothetical protein